MKVRKQLTLLLVLVFSSILIVSLGLKFSISEKTKSLLEANLIETKKKEVPRIIELNDATVKGYAYDYTVWDQMVDFVTNKKEKSWAHEELDGPLSNYKIDYVWVLDAAANNKFASAINNGDSTGDFKTVFSNIPTFRKKLDDKKFEPFFVLCNNSFVKIFPAPIQPTADQSRKTTPQGYLLLGSIVDSAYMSLIDKISGDVVFSLAKTQKDNKEITNAKTGEMQLSYPLSDIDGKAIAYFSIHKKFPFVTSYQKYLNLFSLGFLVLILAIAIVFYTYFKSILLRPLNNISTSLKEHNSFTIESYSKKQDEFGDLSRLIMQFFRQKRKLEIEVENRKRSEVQLNNALDEKYTEQYERKKAEEFLAQQQLALSINSSTSTKASSELVKEIIKIGAKALLCERVGIWLFNEEKTAINGEHVYVLSRDEYVHGGTTQEEECPIYFEHLRRDALIVANDAVTNIATEEFAESYLIPNKISSMLDVPIRTGDTIIGVVCYEHTGSKREWSVSEQVFSKTIADLVTLNFETAERKRVEKELQKSKIRFEETQELAKIGSWEVNLFTKEVIWSKEMYKIFELPQMADVDLIEEYKRKIHKDDHISFEKSFQGLFEGSETNMVECRIVKNNGDIKYIRAIAETIKSAKQQKIVGIRGTVQDITKQKQAALAKSEFLSVMSHEIRTPINGVIGIANLLKDEVLNDRQKEYVNTLNFSAEHLSTVVSDILDFSKIEAGHMVFERVSFNLQKNCRYIYDLFANKAAEKNLSFNFSFQPPETGSYSMYGDYVRLNQVLSNLLSNAIKFTESGSVDFSYNIINDCDDKATVVFSVKDSGIGISESQQKNIFESFTQANEKITRQYGGTGLGLTICKKLIELQNGKINVVSEAGKGSAFIVELTFDKHVYKEKDIKRLTTAETAQKKDLTGMKVLVAEDNKVNAMVLSKFLAKWNITTQVATDGEKAIEFLKQETFDVVLMDIQMPNLDGIEATKIIRGSENTSYSDVTVVAFTADASVDTHRELLKNGFDHCITKPFNPEALFAYLQKNFTAA